VNASDSAKDLIAQLDLSPHPEGGWYREVHRSAQILTMPHGPRAALTSIYYLLEAGQLSRWHLVNSDEIWHLQAGAPLELLIYQPADKRFSRKLLGPPAAGQEPIGAVRAGEWQAARSTGAWSLVGCDVAPGFDFEDFQFVSALLGHEQHFTGEMAAHTDLL
jgi:predicted cupin superfamily sugar epimerase